MLVHDIIDFAKDIDTSIFIFINQKIQNAFFDFLMPIIRNKITWIPIYGILIYLYFKKFKSKAIYFIALLLISLTLSDFLAHQFLKPFFARPRPCYNELINVRLLIESCGGHWSFPSIHAANHFALSVGIILSRLFMKRIWIIILIFWAILIGFAQIYVGVHYPFDVLAGSIYGSLLSFIIFKIMKIEKHLE
ncbi:MAG TPA: phosphatase PAP2 family protein [Chitinophagales bacterium]|nr:phosphatase PAP2 family protein [Chitinophagales bacterium]MCB9075456.1 phosphatase PAP2 family protein [Chitinophagales bacterium]HMU97784.1 phosphatase PAP2 family protein [Chitinophagales bacterium]HMV02774.1 phosphatase PAP2 family protein [Chitinophagales bacterium]HMW93293.1 phosphatase PAP2 family protein [Chitinophagales bacterium]